MALAGLAPAGTLPVRAAQPAGPAHSFELDIQPILTVAGCNQGACHGKARGQNGFALSLFGFDSESDFAAITSEAHGRRVFPAAPDESLLLKKAAGLVPHGGGIRLKPDSEHYRTLKGWIAEGMPKVRPNEPKLVRIAISPVERPLRPSETETLRVTAHYTDSTQRDVTRLAAFQSSDAPIASINEAGLVKAGTLPGETVIMARFMGQIATWNVVIPFSGNIASAKYAGLPRRNFIDGLVWKKLQKVGVLPSEPASDATFLRRASLDLIGKLPTPDEAREFLADGDSNKRSRLVDRLLERPEYADHWANKWMDLLRPNPFHVGMKATMTFDTWIRDVFRQNKPYDQFAKELLTATGSTWKNGAVTMYRDRRTPDELTKMVTQLFLGIRLECAKCHHHPFEVYSQDDFYSLAAYFSKVAFKGNGISAPISGGEEMVYVAVPGGRSQPVKHPLTNELMSPKPLFGKAPEIAEGADPRAALAEWMLSRDNPYFARAAANRVWGELMGRGIVDPVDDLRATNPPSNPELIAALAEDFRAHKFDHKHLLRTIANSHVYQLSSAPNSTNVGDTRNYSRYYRSRLRGETLLDAVSDLTQVPEDFRGMPPLSRATEIWTHRIDSLFLDAFGRPDPNQDPPCERPSEATMTQTLHLMNSPGMQKKVTHPKGRVAVLAASSKTTDEVVTELYLLTYSRPPTEAEKKDLEPYLKDLTPGTRAAVFEDLLWSLMNTPEFWFKN